MLKKRLIFIFALSIVFANSPKLNFEILNDSPIIEYIENQNINEDQFLEISIIATDPDNDNLNYSANADNSTVTFPNNDNLLIVTPDLNYNGTIVVSVFVSDNEFTAQTSFDLIVNSVNDAPAANSESITINEDEVREIVLLASDVDNDPLNYSISGSASNGNIDLVGNIATYTPNLNFSGIDSFDFLVTDGVESSQGTIDITINSQNDLPEVINPIADLIFDEDDPIYSDIDLLDVFLDIEDGSNLTFSSEIDDNLLNKVNVDVLGTDVTIEFLAHRYGSGNITITATDSDGGSISNEFMITINPVNDPPYIVNIPSPDSTIELGETYEWLIDPTGTDVDDSKFDVTMHTNPESGSGSITIETEINELFEFSWTPTSSGLNNLAVTISDRNSTNGQNGIQSTIYNWTVNVVEENNNTPPVINNVVNAAIDEDTVYELLLDIIDVDPSDNIADFTVAVYDEYLAHPSYNTQATSIYENNQWKLQVEPESNWNGQMNIIVTVSDGSNTTIEDFILEVNPVNDAPELIFDTPLNLPLDGQTFDEDSNYNYSLQIYDVDARYYYNGSNASETISYAISASEVINATLDEDNIAFSNEYESTNYFSGSDDLNQITFIPINDYFGQQTFDITITDLDGESDSGTIWVSVSNVNDNPIFEPPLIDQVYDEDSNSDNYTVIAIDDADFQDPDPSFIYSCQSSANIQCSINGSTIVFSNITEHFNGQENISITVNDGDGGIFTDVILVTVNSINDAPVSNDVSITTEEDVPKEGSFLGSDVDDTIGSDTNNPPLNFSIVDDPANGTVINNADGSFEYIPDDNFFGVDTFTFKTTDDEGADSDNVGVVTIQVNEGNDLPVLDFVQDVEFNEDESAVIPVSGTDVESTELEFDCIDGTDIFCEEIDGEITFSATEHFFGSEMLTISVDDGNGGIDTQEITVTVLSVNDPPVTVDNNSIETVEDTPITLNLVELTSDIEDDPSTFTYTLVDDAVYGTCTNNNDGTFTYTPELDFPNAEDTGTDTCTFKADDNEIENSESNISALTITVVNSNDLPILDFVEDVNFDEDQTTIIQVNGSDVDFDELEFDCIDGTDIFCEEIDGEITFSATEHFFGSEMLTISVDDGNGGIDTQEITVTVLSVNDSPVTVDNDSIETTEETPIVIDLVELTSDIEGDPLAFVYTLVADATDGTCTNNNDGTFTYTPELDFPNAEDTGTDTCTFKADDNEIENFESNISTLTITVSNTNDAPVIDVNNFPVVEFDEDDIYSFNISGYDVDFDSIYFSINQVQPFEDDEIDSIATFIESNLEDTILTFMPIEHYNGTIEFELNLSDGILEDDTIFNVVVLPVNDPPQTSDTTYMVGEDSPEVIILEANQVYNENDNLFFGIIDTPDFGVLTYNGDTLSMTLLDDELIPEFEPIVYIPNEDYIGLDTFSYFVFDEELRDTASISITVSEANDAPVFLNDDLGEITFLSFSFYEDTDTTIALNGYDVDLDSIFYSSINSPLVGPDSSHILCEIVGLDSLKITPILNFYGVDSVQAVVYDRENGNIEQLTDTLTILLDILPVNDPPTLQPTNDFVINEGDSIYYKFLINDVDNDYQDLTMERSLDFELIDSLSHTQYIDFAFIQPDSVIITINDDYNKSIGVYFYVNDNSQVDPPSLKDTIYSQIRINPVNDPIDTFALLTSIREYNLEENLMLQIDNEIMEYDTSAYYQDDSDLYLKYPYNIGENDCDPDDADYETTCISDFYQNQPDSSNFYFAWERRNNLDIDTDPEYNKVPNQIYYRLEILDAIENKAYVIADSIVDSQFYDQDFGYISVYLNSEYKTYSLDAVFNKDTVYPFETLNIDAESEYSWRVIAQNYSDDEEEDDTYKTDPSENSFYIDLNYPTGEFYFLLNQIYIDEYDMYFYSEGSETYFQNSYLYYPDIGNDIQAFEYLIGENNIFNSYGTLNQFGSFEYYVVTADARENRKIHKEDIAYQYIAPNEITNISSHSGLLSVEILNNSLQDARILIDEDKISNLDIEFGNFKPISNILNLNSNRLLDNAYIKVKFNIDKLDLMDIDIENVKIAKINEDNSFDVLLTYNDSDYFISDVDGFGRYILLEDQSGSSDYNIPNEFMILSCYPNPFNPYTTINYSVDIPSEVEITVYNLLGEKINSIDNVYRDVGTYLAKWNGHSDDGTIMPTGIYFIEINNGLNKDVRKVTLLK